MQQLPHTVEIWCHWISSFKFNLNHLKKLWQEIVSISHKRDKTELKLLILERVKSEYIRFRVILCSNVFINIETTKYIYLIAGIFIVTFHARVRAIWLIWFMIIGFIQFRFRTHFSKINWKPKLKQHTQNCMHNTWIQFRATRVWLSKQFLAVKTLKYRILIRNIHMNILIEKSKITITAVVGATVLASFAGQSY